LADHGIERYSTNSPLKATPAENAIRIVGTKLYRIMTVEQNVNWIQHLNQVQTSYNNTPQNGKLLGYSPLQVIQDKEEETKVRRHHAEQIISDYKKQAQRSKKVPDLPVGTKVRLLNDRKVFDKQYIPQYSKKIYQISQVLATAPTTYRVSNSRRSYYRSELSPVGDDVDSQRPLYKIIKTRQVPGRTNRSGKVVSYDKEFLIAPINGPDDKNRWVDQTQLNKIERQNGLYHSTI